MIDTTSKKISKYLHHQIDSLIKIKNKKFKPNEDVPIQIRIQSLALPNSTTEKR